LWRRQGRQRPATRAICLAARASRAGSAGKGGIGLRRGRFALRRGRLGPSALARAASACDAVDNCRWRGRFILRRGQERQRPATRAIRLAARERAATAGDAGDSPCGYVRRR